jgi:hypothetical protein
MDQEKDQDEDIDPEKRGMRKRRGPRKSEEKTLQIQIPQPA